jgi:hypothetical protein
MSLDGKSALRSVSAMAFTAIDVWEYNSVATSEHNKSTARISIGFLIGTTRTDCRSNYFVDQFCRFNPALVRKNTYQKQGDTQTSYRSLNSMPNDALLRNICLMSIRMAPDKHLSVRL